MLRGEAMHNPIDNRGADEEHEHRYLGPSAKVHDEFASLQTHDREQNGNPYEGNLEGPVPETSRGDVNDIALEGSKSDERQ